MKRILLVIGIVFFLVNNSCAQKYYQIRWQNKPRNFYVYLPRNFSPSENLPVVINMHGFLTTAQFQMDYSQFNKTADSVRCIAIYPEGVDLRWNSGTFFFISSDVDDIGFLGDLMDRAAVLYNANLQKVYSMGYSAGGFMSYKLACDATNRVAAIAPDVASMVFDNLNSCVPSRPIHMAAFNGTADPVTPYYGIPSNFPGIDSVRHFWQLKNNCNAEPVIDTLPDLRNDGTRVVTYTYQNCAQDAQQVFYKIINGGHVWPGANDIFAGILGKTTQDIAMNTTAWDFFKNKEIPQSVICDAPGNLLATAVSSDSFVLSWNSVAGVTRYKIGLTDDSDKVVFYETTFNTLGVKIDPTRHIRWNVASLCNSGYHNWNGTIPLNFSITGISTKDSDKFTVYPNPVTDELFINISKAISDKATISIYNCILHEILTIKSLSGYNKINVSNLTNGWYQLVITEDDKIFMASFVKK
ncbi:MAG: T9SS type A sorting domain-containing protein [Sphingobacteriales bacterium]|jgi:polyhydroxybutyrate depolymerase|nr:T9SS type A sorting domain-containing protein [Sphingobacteriales bacterium]